MAPKKVTIVEPPKELQELGPFSSPAESPEELQKRIKEEREAEQQELDNAWKKIPYVDKKDLVAGNYAGMEMERLLKPWHYGGHSHDFYKASCPSRPTDLAKHYEFGELLKRHDTQVFELEAWQKREFLKDDMRIQMQKLYLIQKERAEYQKLRKQIRREQLHYKSTLWWPLSPHAVRSEFDSSDEESEPGTETEVEGEGELQEGLPPLPEGSGPEASSSEAGSSEAPTSQATTPRRKMKATPRMRYSLFHYDLPRRLKRQIPPSPPEKPPEYSSPVTVRSPAWVKGKAQYTSDLAQEVIALDAWEEKLPGGGSGGGKK